MNFYSEICAAIESGQAVALVTLLEHGKEKWQGRKMIVNSAGSLLCGELPRHIARKAAERAKSFISDARSGIVELTLSAEQKALLFIHYYAPPPRLIILGGGHVGAALCRMAAVLDYEIVLIDDRPSFASAESHPGAHRLICEQFDRAFDQLAPLPNDYIVIVTRGHQHDRICLVEALRREAAYVGMIGSRSRVKQQLQDMARSGYDEELLARVHAPIGLPIGAVTEGEIALSILAEITKVRRESGEGERAQKEILRELCRTEASSEPVVLATIVAVQGSAPRKSGSQMIIYADGSTRGTVGGGCSEAAVKTRAIYCFDRGRNDYFRVELTAEAAAEEGMACGGIMEVYLELLPPA